ncbi:hypothetical protein TWF281_009815 [Arthrobotrys megalospora]
MKVSLLLPVASAAFAAASFIVIPDEQTIQLVAFDGHQAPITSDNKPKVAEPEKPHHNGEPCHEKDGHRHRRGVHPEFILRGRYRESSLPDTLKVALDADNLVGFSPAAVFVDGGDRFEPDDFYHFYRHAGRHHHHKHGHEGPHGWPHEEPHGWPPHRGPRRGPHGHPEDGGDWPPKPPGEPGHEPPSWPPRPPGDELPPKPPGDKLPWPPKPPGDKPPSWPPKPPGDKPPTWPPKPPGEPGEPGDRPHPPPHWPPKPPGKPDHPGKRPKHPPPHHGWKPHPPNETIWQLISRSNHTSKFAELVSEHEDLVAILNGTIANYTLFVPTNHAFDKFKKPPGDFKPPKDVIKKFLTYHISNSPYPVFKLLLGHTIPSALDGGDLGGAQRIRIGLGPGGLTVNFYSRVVAGNIFATNGVIHAVDSILFPPPAVGQIIKFFPSEFSTFLLAVHVTNVTQEIPHERTGGTLFAPPNSAFQKLGPKINAFLFSPWGRKYLKALLKYHMVVNETLYSDAYYHPTSKGQVEVKDIPKGKYHVDLPTLLEGKHLSIDISRFGGFIAFIINAQSSVEIQDIVAKDGVIQVVKNVLIPPKKPPTGDLTVQEVKEHEYAEDLENTMGMTVKQFCERFEGLVEDDGVTGEYVEEDVLAMWEH